MSNQYPTIIVPAFSRPKSLERLLKSINNAKFPSGANIQLIISLEGESLPEVCIQAEQFKFRHGNKEIIYHSFKQGLKDHLLSCGDKALEYGSVIILEDDLVVDPYFYSFALNTYAYYKHDERIAGIALYSPEYNEYQQEPFYPLKDIYNCYFMQVPCSWGQLWTKEQWIKFKNWLNNSSEDNIKNCLNLPQAVKNWPISSWKKFKATYLIETNRFYVYPFDSYTSNCADEGGTHMPLKTNQFQVHLKHPNRENEEFKFSPLTTNSIKYDSFMEPHSDMLSDIFPDFFQDLEVDLYGGKPIELLATKTFSISKKKAKSAIKVFPNDFKPSILNILSADPYYQEACYSLSESVNFYMPKETEKTQTHLSFKKRLIRKLKIILKKTLF